MNKKFKVLALILSVTMLICALPIMGFAAVSSTNPIEINSVSITDADPLLNVVVNYSVYDGFGDQMTILATSTKSDVAYDSQNQPTNIVYIDQEAKATTGTGSFSFSVNKSDFATVGTLFVKVGGTGITTPGYMEQATPTTPTISADKIAISVAGVYGLTDGRTITIDNTGTIVDPTLKSITVGGATLYYNAARNKFVGIVRTSITSADAASSAVINNTASENLTYGMVNADADITPFDATDIINIYLGTVTATDKQLLAADVNGDLTISPFDATDIINKYLGSISTFTIEGK